MSETTWETIDVPLGQFVGWGNTPGQHVTGIIKDYDATGGTNFNGEPCPTLGIELTEKAASFTKDGARTDYEPGDLVRLNIGQANLKTKVLRADPPLGVGQEIKILFDGTERTSSGNTVKLFKLMRNPATVNKFQPVDGGVEIPF